MLSIGGVLQWIIGFSKTLVAGNHAVAEILEILHGLQICWQHGFRAIDCKCDHFHVVNMQKDAYKIFISVGLSEEYLVIYILNIN